MKIRDKYMGDRPREKMQAKGAKALTNNELAQIIIGSGGRGNDVTKIAQKVNRLLQDKGAGATLDDLCKIPGISLAHATRIIAAFELASRHNDTRPTQALNSPEKVLPLLADIRDKSQEYFACLTLDGANRLIRKRIITIGTLNSSLVHPREVFAPAIEDRAAAIIVAHNHPSGNLDPSPADWEVTERLRKSGEILGIALLDHVVVTRDGLLSIA